MERVTAMLLCEVGAMAFYCTGLWFKEHGDQGMRLVCTLFGLKYMLYGIGILFKPTPTRGPQP